MSSQQFSLLTRLDENVVISMLSIQALRLNTEVVQAYDEMMKYPERGIPIEEAFRQLRERTLIRPSATFSHKKGKRRPQ